MISKGANPHHINDLGFSPVNVTKSDEIKNYLNSVEIPAEKESENVSKFESVLSPGITDKEEQMMTEQVPEMKKPSKKPQRVVEPLVLRKKSNDKPLRNEISNVKSKIDRSSFEVNENPFVKADKQQKQETVRVGSKFEEQLKQIQKQSYAEETPDSEANSEQENADFIKSIKSLSVKGRSIKSYEKKNEFKSKAQQIMADINHYMARPEGLSHQVKEADISIKDEASEVKVSKSSDISTSMGSGSTKSSAKSSSTSYNDLENDLQKYMSFMKFREQNEPINSSLKNLSDSISHNPAASEVSKPSLTAVKDEKPQKKNFAQKSQTLKGTKSISTLGRIDEKIDLPSDYYSTVYLKNAKSIYLVDEPMESQKNEEQFSKPSTEDGLVRVTSAITKAKSVLSINDFQLGNDGKENSKLLINLASIRGLGVSFTKNPDNLSFYCVVRSTGRPPIVSKPVKVGPFFESINFDEHLEIASPHMDRALVLELCVRAEYLKKTKKFRNIIPSSKSQLNLNGPGEIFDEPICQVKIRLSDIKKKSRNGSIVDRKWNWEPLERNSTQNDQNIPGRSLARSTSRLAEAGQSFLKRIQSFSSRSRLVQEQKPRIVKNIVDVVQPGTCHVRLLLVDSFSDKDAVPTRIDNAAKWMKIKKWETIEWISGLLSQEGGDVKFWRLRYFKAIGSRLEAFDEQTMEHRSTIDLKQVQSVFEFPEEVDSELYSIKNSFRLVMRDGKYIEFYANTREEYKQWISVFKMIVREISEIYGKKKSLENLMKPVERGSLPDVKPKKKAKNIKRRVPV